MKADRVCRICGLEKEACQFYKVKHFYKVMSAYKIWCRDCQKMYMEMKKVEEQKKLRDQMRGTFDVCFS